MFVTPDRRATESFRQDEGRQLWIELKLGSRAARGLDEIRYERRLREEVELHLAYRWFCRLESDSQGLGERNFSRCP
jgi:hypothetical protein